MVGGTGDGAAAEAVMCCSCGGLCGYDDGVSNAGDVALVVLVGSSPACLWGWLGVFGAVKLKLLW